MPSLERLLFEIQPAQTRVLRSAAPVTTASTAASPETDPDVVGAVLLTQAEMVVRKRHRGRPPCGWDWDDFHQEVALAALPKVRRWRPGGKFSLREYAYVACCFALLSIQRRALAELRREPHDGSNDRND